KGGEVKLRASAESFRADPLKIRLGISGGETSFDYLVLALPFDSLARLLPDSSASDALRNMLDRFDSSPITGIHVWFDRYITELDHAVLLDRTIQWMFHKSRLLGREHNGGGSYVEVVVSSSKNLVDKSRGDIIDLAVRELREFFPAAQTAS